MDLERLMNPGAIAVVGASRKEGRPGRIIFEMLTRSGCVLYPVHRYEKTIFGRKAYPSIEALPSGTDIAVIAVGAENAVTSAEAAARAGIPYIVVVAGGFSESGPEGRILEDRLRDIPKNHASRVLGPNTLGLFIPHRKLDMIFVEHGDRALAGGGGVAFISQSGSVGVEALGLASNTGYGMRAFVGLGNKCDLDELDFLEYFEKDDGASCIAFYTESFEPGLEFMFAARRTASKKPVVVLKAGRSETGSAAVSSHTGRMAGSDRIVCGAFRQFGIQRALDDEELCDAAKVLSMVDPPGGNRVAILTAAGGYGVMGADHLEQSLHPVPLKMAELSDTTRKKIRSGSVPYASCRNPVDLTASADDRMLGRALDALIEDDGVDIIICVAFFSPPTISDGLVDEIVSRAGVSDKPIIVFTQYGPFTDRYLLRFHNKGVVGFPSIRRAVRAARFLAERKQIVEKYSS
jgi:acyl-CoA synthetase (NDP forming)